MNLPEKAQLTDAKYAEILGLIRKLNVDLATIDEAFVRGSGHGGQKINKTSSAVQLKHLPTGTMVKFQKFRQRSMNRIMALRELLWKLDPNSPARIGAERIRKQKDRRKRRSGAAGLDAPSEPCWGGRLIGN
jgi:protein subunit release factor B